MSPRSSQIKACKGYRQGVGVYYTPCRLPACIPVPGTSHTKLWPIPRKPRNLILQSVADLQYLQWCTCSVAYRAARRLLLRATRPSRVVEGTGLPTLAPAAACGVASHEKLREASPKFTTSVAPKSLAPTSFAAAGSNPSNKAKVSCFKSRTVE